MSDTDVLIEALSLTKKYQTLFLNCGASVESLFFFWVKAGVES